MPHPNSAPTRTLPSKANLDQLRKQAKELLKSYKAGDAAAIAEVGQHERKPDSEKFALADAQRVIARSYGFPSWTRLKQQVEGLTTEVFIAAAAAGDRATVRKLAKARPELVHLGLDYGDSALHQAVLRRNTEMTRLLMQLGADSRVGIWPHRDATSAYTIAKDRRYDEIVAVIEEEEENRRQALSSRDAGSSVTTNIHRPTPTGSQGASKIDDVMTAIKKRKCEEAIRILDSEPALLASCDLYGATPLHVAAAMQQSEVVDWLVAHGARVDARDAEGRTPLDHAAIYVGWSANDHYFPWLWNPRVDPAKFYEIVDLLRSHGAELTPRAAVAIGDRETVLRMHGEGRLKNEIDFWGGGLLTIAVKANRIEMVSLLLDLGLDPDEAAAPTEDGGESWGFPLWFAAVCARHDIAELLLTRGADPSAIFAASGDPLGCAEGTGDKKMEALLLKYGARITIERLASAGTVEMAKAMLEGRIPAHSLNVMDPTPAALASQMLWMGALSGNVEIVRVSLPHIVERPDDPAWNYILVHTKSPDVLKLLMEHGVDPNAAGPRGYTVLHHLASNYHAAEVDRIELATILLDAGASPDKRDLLLKSTPLGWACRWGRRELAELYLHRGADPREPDAEQWARPLAWAEKGQHRDIIKLLRARGAV